MYGSENVSILGCGGGRGGKERGEAFRDEKVKEKGSGEKREEETASM